MHLISLTWFRSK